MPVTMQYAAGDPLYWNYIARAGAAVAVSPAQDALYPSTNLKLADPMTPFRWGSLATTHTVTQDLANTDGNMETWSAGVPVNWSTDSTGTLTQSATAHAGSWSAQLTTSGGAVRRTIWRDFTVRAGEWIHLDFWTRGDTVSAGFWILQNTTTMAIWGGSSWAASFPANLPTTAVWTQYAQDIQVQSYQDCGRNDTVTLRLSFHSPTNAAGSLYVDDAFLWPHVNVMALIGHTFAKNTLTMRGSTDNFTVSDDVLATFTDDGPCIYALTTSLQTYRYYRFKATTNGSATLAGSAGSAPWLGELVVTQTTSSSVLPTQEWNIDRRMPQVRNQTRGRAIFGNNLGGWSPADQTLHFRPRTQALYAELRWDFVHRSGYGQYPMLLIPASIQPNVLWCRAMPQLTAQQTLGTINETHHDVSVDIQEEGLFRPTA